MRDSNKIVDCLTKIIKGGTNELVIFVDPLSYMRNLLEEDIHQSLLRADERL